jgi:ABC-type lipoprotein export system ATPase subunit
MAMLELRDVSKSYLEPGKSQPVQVLRHVNLNIQPGESLAIVGPSGCGKSTLLNLLGTLDTPDSGSIHFEGESLQGASLEHLSRLRSQSIGFIFQLHHLLPQCTVLENVLLPTLASTGQNKSAQKQRAEQLLKRVGLDQRLHWRPAQLSGGERQRAAVVRALINQPKLLLADEPTGALDEKNATALTQLLLELHREQGTALVLVTHHLPQAQQMQRLLQVHEGELLEP